MRFSLVRLHSRLAGTVSSPDVLLRFLCALLLATPAIAVDAPRRAVDGGIVVDLAIDPGAAGVLREGDPAQFTITLKDQTSGTPLSGISPNAWFTPRMGDRPVARNRCTAAIAAFIGGSVFTRPALDLNVYYVIALNDDGSITVVDPHFSFGGTRLLAMVQLDSPGYDWSFGANEDRLFVTMPKAGRVAAIDTTGWKVLKTIDVGNEPRRIVEQPDGHYLWITTAAGVVALRASEMTVAAAIPTGQGAHDVAVTPDSRTAIVTNRDDGTATLIDVATLKVVAQEPAGAKPVSVAWSSLSQLAYVASEDGTITAIDPKRRKAAARIATEAGLERIRFVPGGRYGFTLNPSKDLMHILDVASNRIVQTGELEGGPFEVTFTDTLAYVRRRASELVLMVPLANIGNEGHRIAVVDFPGGQEAFGAKPRTTAADGIVGAPGENAVLVANPADEAVYFYKEGMAAPIGHFTNYGHQPQAVLVLDRSLRERKSGTFSTTATMPAAGTYDVAVFVDAPRVVTCFPVTIAENPTLTPKKPRVSLAIEHLTATRMIHVGEKTPLEFRLTDAKTKQPSPALPDAGVLIVQASGSWSDREPLAATGDGRYTTGFTAPAAGVYYVYVECPSAGLRAGSLQSLVLQAD